jgi:hypothetical protein
VCTPDACAALCADVVSRLQADSSTGKSFIVRSTECAEAGFEGMPQPACSGVVEIDGACYRAIPSVVWEQEVSCGEDAGSR